MRKQRVVLVCDIDAIEGAVETLLNDIKNNQLTDFRVNAAGMLENGSEYDYEVFELEDAHIATFIDFMIEARAQRNKK